MPYITHISTLFAVAGAVCMSSFLSVVLKQAGREDGAQMLSLVTVVIILLVVLGLLDEVVAVVRRTFWF